MRNFPAPLIALAWTLTMAWGAPTEAALRLDLGGGQGMDFLRVEPGEFTQGSPSAEAGRGADETPRVTRITRAYLLGRYPVTRAQWQHFTAETGYRTEAEKGTSGGFGVVDGKLVQKPGFTWKNPGFAQTGEHPVTMVTWFDAKEFLQWLSRRTGRKCALPTEAQWEYASRAGTVTPWPTGTDAAAADAWAWHRDTAGFSTHPVGQKSANTWGFADMGGQVWEWCEDWYGPYAPGTVNDPLQTLDSLSDKPRRVLRGGSFLKDAAGARSAARFRNDPRSRNADNGFRVALADMPATMAAPALPAPAPEPAVEPETGAPTDARRVVLPPEYEQGTDAHEPPTPPGKRGAPWPLVIFLGIVATIVWRIVRGIVSSRQASRPTFRTPFSAGRQQPTVHPAGDGFWVRGNFPPGTMISWMYEIGGRRHEGRTAFQPGPEGMFLFTGGPPDTAEAWIEADADNLPGVPGQPDDGAPDGFRQGLGAGLMMDSLNRQQEQARERERERERRANRPERDYPSAY